MRKMHCVASLASMMFPLLLLWLPWQLVVTAAAAASHSAAANCRVAYDRIAGSGGAACSVWPEFQRLLTGVCGGAVSCALRCTATARCQAFQALPACRCRLFVFDACSHGVGGGSTTADCGGDDLADIFVRRLRGAAPGSLCPPGYSHTRNGTSYKIVNSPTATWTEAEAACAADGALAKLADSRDKDELRWLMSLRTSGMSYHMGGHQLVVSANKKDNWMWNACNIAIDRDIWESGQPDSGYPHQGCACLYVDFINGLDDFQCGSKIGYICECPTVF